MMKTFVCIQTDISPSMPACILSQLTPATSNPEMVDIFTRPTLIELIRDAANLVPVKYPNYVVVSEDFAMIQSDRLSASELLEFAATKVHLSSKRFAQFRYKGLSQIVSNIDPSSPEILLAKGWNEMEQEVFDQLTDGKVFNQLEITEISELPIEEFLLCINFIINR